MNIFIFAVLNIGLYNFRYTACCFFCVKFVVLINYNGRKGMKNLKKKTTARTGQY